MASAVKFRLLGGERGCDHRRVITRVTKRGKRRGMFVQIFNRGMKCFEQTIIKGLKGKRNKYVAFDL